MRRIAWLLVVACITCSLGSAGTPIVVFAPSDYHAEYLKASVEELASYGHSLVLTAGSGGNQLYEALGGLPTGTHIVSYEQVLSLDYHGVLFIGSGWYDDTYYTSHQGNPMPDYVSTATAVAKQALERGLPLAAAGAGVYVFPYTSTFEPGTEFSAYDCEDLWSTIEDHGYTPMVSRGLPPAGSHQYGADAQLVISQSGSSWVGTTSVPDTWYGLDNGEDLWSHYGSAVIDLLEPFSAAVTAAAERQTMSPWGLQAASNLPSWPTVQVINPGSSAAEVTVTYCPQSASEGDCRWGDPASATSSVTTLPKMGATTLNPGGSGMWGAVIVSADQPVAVIANQAQRYDPAALDDSTYSYNAFSGEALSTHWAIPGVSTGGSARQTVTIMNPNPTPAPIELRFVPGLGEVLVAPLLIDPFSQHAVDPQETVGAPWQGAIVVSSSQGVASAVTTTAPWKEGWSVDVSPGVAEYSTTWYLPTLRQESNPAGTAESWIGLYNPGLTPAQIQIDIDVECGVPLAAETFLDPGAAATIRGDEIASGSWSGSVTVTSDVEIAAIASTKWTSQDRMRVFQGSYEGVSAGARQWVLPSLMSCSTSVGRCESQIVVQNTSSSRTDVLLTFFPVGGGTSELEISLDPGARRTLEVEDTPDSSWGAAVVATADAPILVGSITSWHNVLGLRERSFGMFGSACLDDTWYLSDVIGERPGP